MLQECSWRWFDIMPYYVAVLIFVFRRSVTAVDSNWKIQLSAKGTGDGHEIQKNSCYAWTYQPCLRITMTPVWRYLIILFRLSGGLLSVMDPYISLLFSVFLIKEFLSMISNSLKGCLLFFVYSRFLCIPAQLGGKGLTCWDFLL